MLEIFSGWIDQQSSVRGRGQRRRAVLVSRAARLIQRNECTQNLLRELKNISTDRRVKQGRDEKLKVKTGDHETFFFYSRAKN
jgi:molybdenum-dependent DNA-binding transcriptional regulator ModE